MYDHLGLILSANQYYQLLSEEFKVPSNPGAFTPPVTGTAPLISAQRDA